MIKTVHGILIFLLAGSLHLTAAVSDSSFLFINGWEYHLSVANEGHPFLKEKSWKFGSLNSSLGKKDNILMNYDAYRDELVVQQIIKGIPELIVLNPLYINSFRLDGMEFVNTARLGFHVDPSKRGYYRIIYANKLMMLRKYTKELEETGNTRGSVFKSVNRDYLVYSGVFYEIKGNSSIYAVFPEYRKEIRSYLRSNRIILRSAEENQLVALIRFCEQLISDSE